MPTIDDAVDVDPDVFKGAHQAGSGPGPHFIMVSFVKNKDKIRDQLLKALSATVTILAQNVPRVLIHCIQKGAKLPPLSTATSSNFPTTGIKAQNYMFLPNPWSLQPGTRNKLQLPAAKVGKDRHQLYDENRGYNGPNWINQFYDSQLMSTLRRQSIISRWNMKESISRYNVSRPKRRKQRTRS